MPHPMLLTIEGEERPLRDRRCGDRRADLGDLHQRLEAKREAIEHDRRRHHRRRDDAAGATGSLQSPGAARSRLSRM